MLELRVEYVLSVSSDILEYVDSDCAPSCYQEAASISPVYMSPLATWWLRPDLVFPSIHYLAICMAVRLPVIDKCLRFTTFTRSLEPPTA